MMVRSTPRTVGQNQLASILIIGGTLLVAAAAIAELVEGAVSPHRSFGGIARAIVPGASMFLWGSLFLATPATSAEAAPETLPWLQRPRVRRRIAFGYFALGAALILFNLYEGIRG